MEIIDNILYLDDESNNLNVFKSSFKRDYKVHIASNAKDALQILKNEPIKVAISDQRMPDISGTDFLKDVKKKYPDVIRLILTAYTDIDVVINAFNECGIYRYVTKPWDASELKLTIDNSIESFDMKLMNKGLLERLEISNNQLEIKVSQRTKELVVSNNVKSKLFNYISLELEKPIKQFGDFLTLMTSFENAVDLDNAKKYASDMSSSFMQTNMLLEKLYRWASLELKNTGFNPQKCILNNFINSNIEALRISALRNKIALKNELDTNKVVIKADAPMLNFMISNIIQSAIKVGSPNSTVKVGAHSQNGHGVIALSGKSEEMCDFITSITQTPDYLEDDESWINHQDSNLSFMIFKEYLELMEGKMLATVEPTLNEYNISFLYPTNNDSEQ